MGIDFILFDLENILN